MEKLVLKKIYILLFVIVNNSVADDCNRTAFWGDFKFWVEKNNNKETLQMREHDKKRLNCISDDGSFSIYHYQKDKNKTVINTIGYWSYLAELGVSIIKSNNIKDANFFLKTTKNTARFYMENMKPKRHIERQNKMIYTSIILENLKTNFKEGDTFPFNGIASFAYFCAVRNNIKKIFQGYESFYEISTAYMLYNYLQTQIKTISYYDEEKNKNIKILNWKYSEKRNDIQSPSDDIAHAGLAARALAYGADNNLVWRWYTNILFYNNRPLIFRYKPDYMNITYANEKSYSRSAFSYWKYNYLNLKTPSVVNF